MKNATYSPIYCALYPSLAELAKQHGYAMAVHGSTQRDFDVICVPWTDNPSEPEKVVEAICEKHGGDKQGDPEVRLHNRKIYTIVLGWGECFLDLSFMPTSTETKQANN